MKLIKSIVFIFLLTFSGHAFAKSSEYYQSIKSVGFINQFFI
jgi:hypothetical protein